MKTIAITGASGFLGRHLLVRLMKQSDCELRVLVHNDQFPGEFKNNRVKVVNGDIIQKSALYELITPGSIVANLAFLSSRSLEENLKAAQNLMAVCTEKKIKRLIHCSTADVTGRAKDSIVTENTECKPFSEYAVKKFEIEKKFLESTCRKFELVIVRPTAIFGPGSKNLMKLANELSDGKSFRCYVRSSMFNRRKMNLVSVDNVTGAISHLAFVDKNIDGEVFIISDDDQPTNNYRDVEQCLGKHLNAKSFSLPVIPLPSIFLSMALAILKRNSINPLRCYSSEKLKHFGYSGSVKIEDGITLFSKWYKKEMVQRKSAGL